MKPKAKARARDNTVEVKLASLKRRLTREQAELLCGELRSAIADLSTDIEMEYRTAATDIHEEEGKVEIDSDAQVSAGKDGGAYVQAWLWVSDDDLGEDAQNFDANGKFIEPEDRASEEDDG